MSLKVWLPLCGDLKQYGTSDIVASNNGATINTNGKIGSCYSFDGSDDYISLNNPTALYNVFKGGTQQFSITFWIYHNDSTRAIIFGDYGLTGSISFNIELTTTHQVRFYWAGTPDKNFNSTSSVGLQTWTHISLTYDGSKVNIYKNGILLSDVYTGTLATKSKTAGSFYIGRDNRTGTTAFNGCLNDFRIYDHCLSAAEVHEISQGLVLHYKLDDISHGIVDSSGYSHNGIMTNNITFTNNTPRYSNATFLNKVRINSASGFPSGENPVFTVCFWTKILSTITYVSYGDLIGFYDKDQGNNTFRLELCGSPASNNLMWFRGPSGRNGGGFNMNSSSSSGWFSKDTWHHIALVGDGINKKYYCYLDGKLCGSYNGSANTWEPTGQWYLSDTTEATAYFSDVRIYCTALSADDIFTLYHTSAKVDNKQNLHSFEFIEDQSKISITKRGQTTSDKFNEITSTKFKKDTTIETAQLIEF